MNQDVYQSINMTLIKTYPRVKGILWASICEGTTPAVGAGGRYVFLTKEC